MKPCLYLACFVFNAAACAQNALPVWGSWNTGEQQRTDGQDAGYSPDWQFERIKLGQHIHPTFELFSDSLPGKIRQTRAHYFEPLWSHARENRLPLVFIGRNLAMMFREFEPWKSLETDHPFIEYADGTVNRWMTSPWNSNARHWYDLGFMLGQYLHEEFAADYPNPPHVYIGDNNEVGIADLKEALKDVALPPYLKGAERHLVARELQLGYRLRRGLFIQGIQRGCPEWADVIEIYAYSAFGNEYNATDAKADPYRYRLPWGKEWGGYNVTANVGYIHSWSTHSAHKVRSPQVEACNSRHLLNRYRTAINADFDLETHFWNGRKADADVWQGVVRCVLWIMRTQRNRIFLGAAQTVAETYDTQMAGLVAAVEQVHGHPVLREFWQHGTLLPNRWTRDFEQDQRRDKHDNQTGYGHPYYWPMSLPPEDRDPGDRWFLQHVPINGRFVRHDTVKPGAAPRMTDRWRIDRTHQQDIRVFAIALQHGDRYLIYAHAPMGAEKAVEIQVCPDGHQPRLAVTVDVPTAGQFWVCEPTVAGSFMAREVSTESSDK